MQRLQEVQTTVSTTAPSARELLVALGRRVRAFRERKGLTQEAFAARCGISVSFASLLERGERSPSYETLIEMARALEVQVGDLFRESAVESYDDPYYARLLDFARTCRISRAQVDRLIAVGRAMFGFGTEVPGNGPVAARPGVVTCTYEGCTRPVLAKGLCASHYHRARRAKL